MAEPVIRKTDTVVGPDYVVEHRVGDELYLVHFGSAGRADALLAFARFAENSELTYSAADFESVCRAFETVPSLKDATLPPVPAPAEIALRRSATAQATVQQELGAVDCTATHGSEAVILIIAAAPSSRRDCAEAIRRYECHDQVKSELLKFVEGADLSGKYDSGELRVVEHIKAAPPSSAVTTEHYLFMFTDSNIVPVRRLLGRYASDASKAFDWDDATTVHTRMKELSSEIA